MPHGQAPADDDWMRHLRSGAGTPPSGCPSANALAALVSDGLAPAAHAVLARHLADCADCREAVALLAVDRPGVPARMRWPAAAAALVLVSLCAWWLVRAAPGADPEAALPARVARLAARHQELAGFAPLTRAERLAPGDPSRGPDAILLAPAGTILDLRPTLRWRGAGGVARWQVTILRSQGERLWQGETSGTELAFPAAADALAAGGEYVWQVAGRGLLGAVTGARAFRVARAEDAAVWSRALALLAAEGGADERAVLASHFALRCGLLEIAEQRAREAVALAPQGALARETLYQVLVRLGVPEAATWLPEARR